MVCQLKRGERQKHLFLQKYGFLMAMPIFY